MICKATLKSVYMAYWYMESLGRSDASHGDRSGVLIYSRGYSSDWRGGCSMAPKHLHGVFRCSVANGVLNRWVNLWQLDLPLHPSPPLLPLSPNYLYFGPLVSILHLLVCLFIQGTMPTTIRSIIPVLP